MVEMELYSGFAWAVPKAFGSALHGCRFEQGDVLYSDASAYDESKRGKDRRRCADGPVCGFEQQGIEQIAETARHNNGEPGQPRAEQSPGKQAEHDAKDQVAGEMLDA